MTQPAGFELARYFTRIGFADAPRPDLGTLRALHRAHALAIPFENLDPLRRRPVRLDPAALSAKLIEGGRGGYCYEQNLLFLLALDAIGFTAAPLLARVLWRRPPDHPTPRTHSLLRVMLAGEAWIADVGFGGCMLTDPLRLRPGDEQPTALETFRLIAAGDEYDLQMRGAEGWVPVYRIDPRPVLVPDLLPANWYHSTCPDSPFTHRLLAFRPTPKGRHELHDATYTFRQPDGQAEQAVLADAGAVLACLEGTFQLRLERGLRQELGARLEQLIPAGPHG